MTRSAPSITAAAVRLTPELAQIDSELGVAAAELRELARQLRERRRVPVPQSDPCARAVTERSAKAHTATRPKPAPSPSRPRPTVRPRFATVSMFVAVAAAIGASALGAVPAAGQRVRAVQTGVHAFAAAPRDRALSDARDARMYTWSAVPGARSYQVTIMRGGSSIFEATTRELAVELPQELRMAPGRYTWLVTPVFGKRGSTTRPLVEATFVVAP